MVRCFDDRLESKRHIGAISPTPKSRSRRLSWGSLFLIVSATWLVCLAAASFKGAAQESLPSGGSSVAEQSWNLHFQNTDIVQGDPSFAAKYYGPNSLNSEGEVQETVAADVFLGLRLWRGAEAHVDGLMWQGFGLSKSLGVEAFPNGDSYKAGTTTPDFMFARLFIRQTIGFGGAREAVPDDQLTLAGAQDISRLTITVGRMSVLDIFDHNVYAHDPQSQFMNWAMVGNVAWDYPADQVGYTTGIAVEFNQPEWTLRYGFFQMPSQQNGFTGDDPYLMWRTDDRTGSPGAYGPFLHDWGMLLELERRYSVNAHPGAIRFMPFLNEANMLGNHAAISILQADGPHANISAANGWRYKYGFGLNWEQEMTANVGLFSRLGWNDGREQAWAYTDVNWTVSLGASVKGAVWRRPTDIFGIAGVISGASPENQRYLELGGLGILAGDGNLNYGTEKALETYYAFPVWESVSMTADYQFVSNPAFNRDRGPVSVFGARLHWEI
jgi:high affinity Mn2+ porin